MTYVIVRTADWHLHLAAAVDKAQEGDRIHVSTPELLELAVIALRRKGKDQMNIEVAVSQKCEPEAAGDPLMPDEIRGVPAFDPTLAAHAKARHKHYAKPPEDVLVYNEPGLPEIVRNVCPPLEPMELLAVDEAAQPPFEKLFPTGYIDMREVRATGERICEEVDLPGPTTVTTRKPTEEEIAEHQRKHGIKPSDLLPTGADPAYERMLGVGKYRRFFNVKKVGAEDNKKMGEAAEAARQTVSVEIQGPTPGVPNKNGDTFAPGAWDRAMKEYHEKARVAKETGQPVVAFEQTVLGSPEYACQQCGKEYLYVDAYKLFCGSQGAANCFCSIACRDAYLAKHKRWPGVGAEILLGEPQLCTFGRTDEQIKKAESDLIAKFMAEDEALVYAAVGDVPFVRTQDSVVYEVTVEQMDLIQRLFRLRRKLPEGFRIVRGQ